MDGNDHAPSENGRTNVSHSIHAVAIAERLTKAHRNLQCERKLSPREAWHLAPPDDGEHGLVGAHRTGQRRRGCRATMHHRINIPLFFALMRDLFRARHDAQLSYGF
jgi:hypothetical protein